jgi:hypothetical protein
MTSTGSRPWSPARPFRADHRDLSRAPRRPSNTPSFQRGVTGRREARARTIARAGLISRQPYLVTISVLLSVPWKLVFGPPRYR